MDSVNYSMMEQQSLQNTFPTLKLREKLREYAKAHRDQVRANSLDSLRFGIGEIKEQIHELGVLTEKDVTGLASRIKRRKHATNEDMYRLSHAFLQEEKNIEIFNKIPGAIQILIKEFTGKDSERQLSSAECLCNLSLGQAPVCEKISSLAGSYLVTYIHTTEDQLVRMCLWTIANILTTSIKGALRLMQMQLLSQLWKLYTNDNVADDLVDFREDAATCLQIIALQSEMLLKNDGYEHIFKHLVEKNPTCLAGEYHLQIVFHSLFSKHEFVNSFTTAQQQYLICYSLRNICSTREFKTYPQRLRIVYSTRVLSDLIACHPACYSTLLEEISTNWQTNLASVLNSLFGLQNPYLNREVLWLLKNLLNADNSIGLSRESFLEKLKIPRNSSQSDAESMSF